MKSVINNKKSVIVIGIGITILMFVLNCLTLYCADDYSYHYNLADGTAINNLADIFRALYDHYFVHTGRVFPHFFAYLFLLLPKFIFNIANAVMFTIQLLLVYRIGKAHSEKHNMLIIVLIFGIIWVFEPYFGQVNLWVDGSCNYLFAIVFALFYFESFVKELLGDTKEISRLSIVAWCAFSFMVGGYSENLSFCLILGCVLVMGWMKLIQKRKCSLVSKLRIGFGFAGYMFMVMAPATLDKQAATFSISNYLCNFKDIVYKYYDEFKIPLMIWTIMLVLAIYAKVQIEKIFLSFVCVFISVCSCLILMVASYLSGRSMAASAVFLVMASVILAYEVWETEYQIGISLVAGYIITITLAMLVVGCYDIVWTYNKTAKRETYLKECAANGIEEVIVEPIDAQTRWSSSCRLPELDAYDPTVYPNKDYEKYYGIPVILGIEKAEEE